MAKRHTDIPRQPVHKWASAQFGSYSRKSDAGAIGVGEPPDRPASGPRDQGRSADQAMRSRRPQISRSGGRSKAILWLIPPLPPPRFSARNGRYGTPGGVCLACARKDLGHLADVFSYMRLLQAGLLERTREAPRTRRACQEPEAGGDTSRTGPKRENGPPKRLGSRRAALPSPGPRLIAGRPFPSHSITRLSHHIRFAFEAAGLIKRRVAVLIQPASQLLQDPADSSSM
jgi:hypothetical protein